MTLGFATDDMVLGLQVRVMVSVKATSVRYGFVLY